MDYPQIIIAVILTFNAITSLRDKLPEAIGGILGVACVTGVLYWGGFWT